MPRPAQWRTGAHHTACQWNVEAGYIALDIAAARESRIATQSSIMDYR
jgi:hypothetical protein